MWTTTLYTLAALNLACGNVFLALALSAVATGLALASSRSRDDE